jgi:[acyl-carrier-protein] S-malonyltransferase
MELAKTRGAKRAVMLPMSAPSHCSLMRPAAQRLAELLAQTQIVAPAAPVINNADVGTPADGPAIRDSLVRQLSSAVRWVETVQAMQRAGVRRLVECGPGSVLTGLNKRIAPEVETASLKDAQALQDLAAAA